MCALGILAAIAITTTDLDQALDDMVSLGRQLEADARPEKRPLFQPDSPGNCTQDGQDWSHLATCGLAGGLYLLGRRRRLGPGIVLAFAALIGAELLAQAAGWTTCHLVGGSSRGGFLVMIYAQTAPLVVISFVLWRFAMRPGGEGQTQTVVAARPPMPWLRAVLLGALYMLIGGVGIAFAVLLVNPHAQWEIGAGTIFPRSPIHSFGMSGLPWAAAIAFVFATAVLAPIGEELLFRGVVLPWLRGLLSDRWALALSGVLFGGLHLYYGSFVVIIVWYGVVLGWVRLRSQTMRAPIALHMAQNTMACLAMLLRGL